VIRVFIAQHPAEAHFFKCVLDTAGIESEIRHESLFGASGGVPVNEARPELWVLDDARAAEAAALLRQQGPPGLEASRLWRCASCGELVEPQFTACWKCGADAPV